MEVSPEYSNVPGPAPDQRHAQPSGPWPWMDVESLEEVSDAPEPPIIPLGWRGYPQSDFPNWTPAQVKRSGIREAIDKRQNHPCKIYSIDVLNTGLFKAGAVTTVYDTEESRDKFWNMIDEKHPPDIRVRSFCVENMSGPVLQMLGHKYTIEPFFFSSSLNWIPSRFQEIPDTDGDHITITLTFLRSIRDPATDPQKRNSRASFDSGKELPSLRGDPQACLSLSSSQLILRQDLLAVHMVRSPKGSTIISYHPDPEWRTTSAKILHSRIKLAGDSVYWQNIFQQAADPTFVMLTILWHCLYTWDHALEALYAHISWLEAKVVRTNDMQLATELHIIRAHLLHYDGLLHDFQNSVVFIRDTNNPALEFLAHSATEKENAKALLVKECGSLLSEIARLQRSRDMQNQRLKNVMNLGYTLVNIDDSKYMQRLTEAAREDNAAMKTLTLATVADSAAMKQIAYLNMFFLPATFVTGVFGMNIYQINPSAIGSLAHFVEVTIPLTLLTIWIIMALQSKQYFGQGDATIFPHLIWPYLWWKRVWKQWRSGGRLERVNEVSV